MEEVMKFEDLPRDEVALALILKRNNMKKETWIKNVVKIYPDMPLEAVGTLYNKIFNLNKE